jgi:hypothetical protein
VFFFANIGYFKYSYPTLPAKLATKWMTSLFAVGVAGANEYNGGDNRR